MIWRYPYFWKHPASQLSSVNNENRFPCLVADRPSLRWRFPARDRFASGPCNTGKKRGEILCLQRGLCDFWKIVCLVWSFSCEENDHQTMAPNESIWWNHDSSWGKQWSVYSRKHCRIGSSWFQFVGWWDVFRRSNRNRLNSNVWFVNYMLIVFMYEYNMKIQLWNIVKNT